MTEVNGTVRSGQRTFAAGAIVLIVFGGTHLLAVYNSFVIPPSTPQEQALDKALRDVLLMSFGPLKPTFADAVHILNSSYSVLLLFVGVVDLMCWRAMAAVGRLGRLALTNLIFTAIIAIIPTLLQFPPPAVLGAIAAVLFFCSWRGQSATRSANGIVENGATA
jgi:hypothetical protein